MHRIALLSFYPLHLLVAVAIIFYPCPALSVSFRKKSWTALAISLRHSGNVS